MNSADAPVSSDGTPEAELEDVSDDADIPPSALEMELSDDGDDEFEFDGADDALEDEDLWDEDHGSNTDESDEDVVLSDADEEDLQAELAKIAEESEREVKRAKRESRRIMIHSDRDADTGAADTSRLFEATASRLSTAETSRRLANFEHLKAAVAARAADRQMAEREERERDEKAAEYREDLARVMRPQRVQVDTSRRDGASEGAPSPLVLVTEQRVEESRSPAAQASHPQSTGGLALAENLDETLDDPDVSTDMQTPLRLENAERAAVTDAPAQDDVIEGTVDEDAVEDVADTTSTGGLGSSLVNIGLRTGILRRSEDDEEARAPDAEELLAETDLGEGLAVEPATVADRDGPAEQGDGLTQAFRAHAGDPDPDRPQDYLELAAAWMLRHEEQPAVSRPVLMRLVTIASDGQIGRESALRAFGILLREGKLEKIGRGQFRLTARSRHYGH